MAIRERCEPLPHTLPGCLASIGVYLRVRPECDVANSGDLLLSKLEELAAAKGALRVLLDKKWRKVYKAKLSSRACYEPG